MIGFRASATGTDGSQRSSAYYLTATQVLGAHRHGGRQARAGPGRTALGVSDGEGMRVARPRRGEGRLVTHIGGGLQRVRVRMRMRVRVSGEGEGEGEG